MKKSTYWLLGAAIILAAISVEWLFSLSASTRRDPDEARLVVIGETVYRNHCASCHGAKLEGEPDWKTRKPNGRFPAPPHDETGHTWHHADETLFQITKTGLKPPLAPVGYESDMPAFGGVLTDEQIWAVLAFIKSKWPEKIRKRHSSLNKKASS
ncbi:MAG TPA: cytochrome c [Burkholderiaceae bacterium]|nr:cytochrome c [Burkholderiaceae bacterium]